MEKAVKISFIRKHPPMVELINIQHMKCPTIGTLIFMPVYSRFLGIN